MMRRGISGRTSRGTSRTNVVLRRDAIRECRVVSIDGGMTGPDFGTISIVGVLDLLELHPRVTELRDKLYIHGFMVDNSRTIHGEEIDGPPGHACVLPTASASKGDR